jgi:hypothetical protein
MPRAYMDAGFELEIGFSDFKHLGGVQFAFSTIFQICRDEPYCLVLSAPRHNRGRSKLSDAKLFNCLPIDLDAEARLFRNVDPTGSLDDRLFDDRHSDGMLRLVEFQ